MDPYTLLTLVLFGVEQVPIVGPYVYPAFVLVLAIMGACAFLAAHLPPPTRPAGRYYILYHGINTVGQNYRFASNALSPFLNSRPVPHVTPIASTTVTVQPVQKGPIIK